MQGHSRGFTLLELIVAFTILALMAGMIFASLRIALNSYEKSQVRIEEEARKRILFDQLKRQIGSLYPLNPTAGFLNEGMEIGLEIPELVDTSNRAPMEAAPLFFGDSESVTFITVAPLGLSEVPGMAVTRYGRAQDEYGREYLGAMETQYRGLQSFLTMAGSPRGKPIPLVEGIESLEFQYYGFDPQTQLYDWFSSWNGQETLSVPEAIKILFNDKYVIVPVNATSQQQAALRNVIPTVGF